MSGTNSDQHVNMVGGAVDDQRSSVHPADDAAEIAKQIGAKVGLDQTTAAVCGED